MYSVGGVNMETAPEGAAAPARMVAFASSPCYTGRKVVIAMSENKTPVNTHELYDLLMQTPELCGQFTLVSDHEIKWDIYEDFSVSIGVNKVDACIALDKMLFGRIPNHFTHWHPDPEDIYDEICAIGTRGHVLVIRKFLLGEMVLYMGPEADCPYSPNKKWRWGRIYYLRAE